MSTIRAIVRQEARRLALKVLQEEKLRHVIYAKSDDDGNLNFLFSTLLLRFKSDEQYHQYLSECNDAAALCHVVHADDYRKDR